MGKPKRNLHATAEETSTPPTALEDGCIVAKIVKGEGNNLWSVQVPDGERTLLVELPARFRSTIWLKRGGFVVINTNCFKDRNNKLGGEIANVVREEKRWKKQKYWSVSLLHAKIMRLLRSRPKEFEKKPTYLEESDDEVSVVGTMPPTQDSEEEIWILHFYSSVISILMHSFGSIWLNRVHYVSKVFGRANPNATDLNSQAS